MNSPPPLAANPPSSAVSPTFPAATDVSSPPQRVVSLDALRGFDMFWILGADAVLQTLGSMSKAAPMKVLAGQVHHKPWAGFAFYDLIFPLFIFIVGASVVFSLSRLLEKESRATAVKRVLLRGALLYVLGLFYSGGVTSPWPDIRLLGVLPRIALAYTATGLLFCCFRPRTLAALTGVLLVGYWALLTFVPIRDFQLDRAAFPARFGTDKPTLQQVEQAFEATTTRVTGGYAPGLNLSNHLDFVYLGGRRYDTYYDPEGLLSTLPAIATCLLGVFAGLWLRRADRTDRQKLRGLVLAGAVALALGHGWGLSFPIVKKLWTSSFVLVAGGWSLLLLAGFYYLVDVRKWRGWCQPFVWIGMNAITLYLAANIIGFRRLAQRLAGGDVKAFFETRVAPHSGDLVIAVVGLLLVLWLARFLYRRQIFLRV